LFPYVTSHAPVVLYKNLVEHPRNLLPWAGKEKPNLEFAQPMAGEFGTLISFIEEARPLHSRRGIDNI
jgi:hypothetical protein